MTFARQKINNCFFSRNIFFFKKTFLLDNLDKVFTKNKQTES